MKEVGRAVRGMANDKAPGPDAICAEALKAGGKATTEMTHSLIDHIWNSKTVPAEMGEATIILLPKDARNPNDPAQQRPISLTNTWYKVLDKIMAEKIATCLEESQHFAEPQYGFRKNRSTAD